MRRPSLARRVLRRIRGKAPEVAEPQMFEAADIDALVQVYVRTWAVEGGDWDQYRHAHMRLPEWFHLGLDPLSEAYRDQQMRLWQLITGVQRPYAAEQDEIEEAGWSGVDPVRQPGYYQRRDPGAVVAASDHMMATAMLLKHSGLKAGDRALEYGAGFGQTALALARLGVEVDTVDISATFCELVRRQGEHFQVPLTAHHGVFGMNPRPEQRYRLIWFYESFHHCLEFRDVVAHMAQMLERGGRVILGGEPIVEREYEAVPYAWGMRLHSEAVVAMRRNRWCELGFSEVFLFELFMRSGFAGRRVDCEPSPFGRLYIFERSSEGARRDDASTNEALSRTR